MLRECPMTPLRVPSQGGGCGVSSCDRGREHGFGALRLPALRFVRTASGSARPRPRLQRHAPRLGGFLRYRGAPRSPRGHKNPHGSRLAVCSSEPPSDSMWLIVPVAGRLPAEHRDCGDNGTVRPFRRPRRRQPTTLPVAALWVAAPYHAVTRAALTFFLAIALPPLARRPLQPPVTTPFAPIRPPPPAGEVTGGSRVSPGRERPQLAPIPVAPVRRRRYMHDPLSPLPVPTVGRARASRVGLVANRRRRRLHP